MDCGDARTQWVDQLRRKMVSTRCVNCGRPLSERARLSKGTLFEDDDVRVITVSFPGFTYKRCSLQRYRQTI